MDADDARIAQALTDVATIGLIQQRELRERDVLIEQLQAALTSRVVIEQATGMLAERHAVGLAEAFALLRKHARDHNSQLTDLARLVIAGATALSPPATTTRAREPERAAPPGEPPTGPEREHDK